MSDLAEKNLDLIPVTDFLEIIQFFDEGARTNADVFIWTKDQKETANEHLISLSQTEKMIYTTVPKLESPKDFYTALQKAGDLCFLNMKLERALIFFTSKFCTSSFTSLQFRLPTKIFKTQRRLKQRLKILTGYVLRVSFHSPEAPEREFKQKIYDISSGGLSFLVEPSENLPIQPGQILEDMTFILRNRTFTLLGEVIHCKPITIESAQKQSQVKIKVGVKFCAIDLQDESLIDNYVAEENRRLFSRNI